MTVSTMLDELHARRLAFRDWWAQAQRRNRLPEDAARDAFFSGWKARAEWKTNEGEERE